MTDPRLVAARLALVALGSLLCLAAARRGWRPPVWTALAVGLGLRVVMLALVQDVEPYDLVNDFHRAGENILAHRDPILHTRPLGWNYTPLYAFVLAPAVWVEQSLGVPWLVVGRIAPIAFDLGVMLLVGRLASPGTSALRRFQYGCLPLPIMVSAVHGQMEPLCLLFAVGAFVVVRRPWLAGALLGLAVSVKSWPALFLPALLLGLPGARERIRAAAAAAAVPAVLLLTLPLTAGTPVAAFPHIARTLLGYSPSVGTWGWPAVLLEVRPAEPTPWEDPFYLAVRKVGTLLTLAAVVAALWLWRRARATDTALAVSSAFQAVTASHGVQYLLWPTPFAVADPPRRAAWLFTATGLYTAVGYLVLPSLTPETWAVWGPWYPVASVPVVLVVLWTLPWGRRARQAEGEGPVPEAHPVPAGARGAADR
ncbi:uncharacterized protein DUF2029 [Actinocorallia herbida]|uniref:Uncharacterized protein DUF2029 n=1 Tax=Actinocorallia herbida TaxID=58109 RepID=A0A3N1CN04_9ACTN|nr:glycosyltransferase 87 family protein [Actinocorallia herbida]ROO82699.1 uncharacterized protein DUF2029 [Actinocorallia herbida]